MFDGPRRRVTLRDAAAAFRARTGRDPHADPELVRLVLAMKDALNAASRGSGEPKRRGRPAVPERLQGAVGDLVAALGPTDGALLALLHGLDESRAFPGLRRNHNRPEWDALAYLRQVAQRFDAMARAP